ncbi:hypothetical protein K1719_042589, partial [Acacia pycnantha]
HRAKRLEHQQLRKAIADLRRRRVRLEKKIDWKSEAEAFRKLSHHTYSIQKESEAKKHLEELAAAEALIKLSHHMYSIQKESEGEIEKRLEEVLEAVKNITSSLIHLLSILCTPSRRNLKGK